MRYFEYVLFPSPLVVAMSSRVFSYKFEVVIETKSTE
jgi:hypothetical protein